ncbi:sulfotransferase [Paracoccus sp. R86501]|uniref:sulfotransferase n=1 Tax=Paracoccus sp. R86501 TaxID=3101711 RepID=UPI00366C301C
MQANLYPALHAPQDGYVFVVTYGRSGSTLTQKLLNSIPGYQIRGENGNILYHLARAATVTSTWENFIWRREDINKSKQEQKEFLRDIIGTSGDPWYGAELVNPNSFRCSIADKFVSEILRPNKETRVSGFKEIRWHEDRVFFPKFLRFIKFTFPKSKFIFQTRTAGDVAKSAWWKNRSQSDVLEMIASADRLYAQFSKDFSDSCFTVEYERYAEGPSYVKEIFDFLNEDLDIDSVASILGNRLRHA